MVDDEDLKANAERYIREWLDAMAAGGYVTYCKDSQTYRLEPEQAVALLP